MVGAEPENVLERIGNPAPAVRGQGRQHLVEGVLVTQHAGGNLVHEPAVGVGEILHGAIEGAVERLASTDLLQDGTRGFSRGRTFRGVVLLHRG